MVALSITAFSGITTSVVFNLLLELIFSTSGGKLAGHDISLQRLLQELSGLSSFTPSLTYIVARRVAPEAAPVRIKRGPSVVMGASRRRGCEPSSG